MSFHLFMNFTHLLQDLLVLEAKLKEYDDFKPDIECHKMLADLNSRIFQVYQWCTNVHHLRLMNFTFVL